MAGGGEGPKLTGIARIFNSETNFGRANVNIEHCAFPGPDVQDYINSFVLGGQGYIRRPWIGHPVHVAEAQEEVKRFWGRAWWTDVKLMKSNKSL